MGIGIAVIATRKIPVEAGDNRIDLFRWWVTPPLSDTGTAGIGEQDCTQPPKFLQ